MNVSLANEVESGTQNRERIPKPFGGILLED